MAGSLSGNDFTIGSNVYRLREVCGSTGGLNTNSQNHTKIIDVALKTGTLSITEMYEAVLTYAPNPFEGMVANGIQYREDDDTGHWLFNVEYDLTVPESQLRWGFDTSGGTVRMYTSKNTASFPATGRTAPDFQGAIGVKSTGTDTEPEGVDVITPVLKLTATFRHAKNTIDLAYVNAVAGLSGCTNSALFYGYEPGELLFLGCVGELIPNIPTEIRYEFAASKNVSGLSIGAIAGIAKKGHDYLWVAFEPEQDTSAKKLVQRPLAAYVERVYDQADFAALDIGTA